MNEYKEKVIKKGNYTICPIALKSVLTPSENTTLEILIYFEDIMQKHISISMLQFYTLQSNTTAIKCKNNLSKLDFINWGKVTTKGVSFSVNWETIYNLITDISLESNPLNRLKIANQFRIEKGLDSICDKMIKEFEGSSFDDNIMSVKPISDKIIVHEDKPIKKAKPKTKEEQILFQLNLIQSALDSPDLDLSKRNNYNNEINRLKLVASNNRIMILKQNNRWIIQ